VMAQTTTCSVEPLPTTFQLGDPCYWDAVIADQCGDCFGCYAAGGDTCDGTDCAAYLECLGDHCEGCENEFMAFFICKDNYYQCQKAGVRCSIDGYNMMGGSRRVRRLDHDKKKRSKKREEVRKGIKDTGSISK
jgi:hypothetical protein